MTTLCKYIVQSLVHLALGYFMSVSTFVLDVLRLIKSCQDLNYKNSKRKTGDASVLGNESKSR